MTVLVTNRSDSNVTYSLDELRIRRVYTPNETKEIEVAELEALFQMDGGATLIKNYLLVKDKDWVMSHWDAPIEYFWGREDIEKCLLTDSLELFEETLRYAPEGVIDIVKTLSWQLPLADLNKVEALRAATGFDAQLAAEVMKTQRKTEQAAPAPRLRKET